MKRTLVVLGVPLFIMAILVSWVFFQIPSATEIKGCLTTKMARIELCPGSKNYVPLRSIASSLQRAVVISEDASFWTHHGFDWESLEKSARENWTKGRFKRGGSTITQQLAKNMFLSKDKTLTRKLVEALITYKIEKTLTKKEILERYLNVVEFGPNTYGVKAAARFYFKKPAADLSIVESAFLAMVLPNPKKYSRSHQLKNLTPYARRRINRIISDMTKTGRITAEDGALAGAEMEYFLGGTPPPAPPALEQDLPTNDALDLDPEEDEEPLEL